MYINLSIIKNNNMIKVYRLEGCNKCNTLITLLDKHKIKYTLITNNESNDSVFDLLENRTNCQDYPIVNHLPGKYIIPFTCFSLDSNKNITKYNNITDIINLIK